MARSVTFNGITQFRPGGLTRINSSALAQIGLATNGIVGLIGEAEGGPPLTIVTIDDPALAKGAFRNGKLADAIRVAFDASNDPRIPGGAFRCLCLKVNNSTQAALTLYNRIDSVVVGPGSTTSVIQVPAESFTVDELKNNILRSGSEDRVILTNTATAITLATPFSAIPATSATLYVLAPMIVFTSKDYGAHTNQIKQEWEPGVTSGGAWSTSFGDLSQVSDDLGDKSFLQVEYIGQSTRVLLDGGTADGAGSTTQIADSTKAWTPSAWIGFFVKATGGALTTPNFRKISANGATTVSVTNAFQLAPGIGATYEIRKGQILTGALLAAGSGSSLTLPGTGVDAINVAANELAGMVVAITTGVGAGQRRSITSNTAGTAPVLTLDCPWTTLPGVGDVYEIHYVTQATGSFVGSLGKATAFRTMTAVNGAVSPTQELNITISPLDTVEQLAATINANTNYKATIPSYVNKQTTLASSFDFDLGATGSDLRNDLATVTTQPTPTLAYTVPWPNNFKRNLSQLVDDINVKNQWITAAKATTGGTGTGGGRPEWTGGSVGVVGDTYRYLSGGSRGHSHNSDWQTAFDMMLQVRHNFVVPLIVEDLANEGLTSDATWSAVAAQLSAHVSMARGVAKNECGGIIGYKGTKTQILSQVQAINNEDIQLCGQRIDVLDVDSNLVTQDAWAQAVEAAGMRSGAPEVGEPLTHKYLKAFAITQDTSWDPRDRTDANQMIAGGVLFAEFVQGKGIRWVRDLTTYLKDDNLAYMEGSTRDVVRYVAYGLRTTLEDRFTGVKGSPANAASIKDTAVAYLDACNADNIVVTSLNDNGETVPGYEQLRVTISGDIATIKVMIYPAVGINFQLNDIYLQLPRQAA